MGFIKGLGRARDKFIRGSIYRDAIKPMIMQNLMAAANPSTPMGGSGRYYRKRRKSYKGRGMYTGMGMYTGQGTYKYPTYKGRGKYTPATNAIVSYGASSSSKSDPSIVPMFNAVNKDTVQVSRREYVAEIYGPPLIPGTNVCEPFALQQYAINPGLEKTFRWLSQIASNFDEYELQQCIFTFKSTTTESGNQSNGQVGTVIMATNYNAAAPVFREKNTMMQYAGAVSSRLTETCIHGVECDPRLLSGSRGEYVRTNPVVTNQDIKTYDHGSFQIAIANCVSNLANQSLGELWVSYTIKLRKPKFFTALGLGITKDLFKRNASENSTFTQLATGPILGSNFLSGQQNNLGCLYTEGNSAASDIRIINPLTGLPGNPVTLNAGPYFTITFPAAFSGYLKIQFSMEVNPTEPNAITLASFINFANGVGQSSASGAVQYLWCCTGNVKGIRDMYGTYDNSYDDGILTPTFALGNSNANGSLLVAHISVDIATNGINNSLSLYFGPNTGGAGYVAPSLLGLKDAYLEVGEYNSGFSYTATGLGTNNAPVLVNRAGVIVPQF